MRTQLVAELHQSESHSRRCRASLSPATQKDRGIAGVSGALGYWIPDPYRVSGDVLPWEWQQAQPDHADHARRDRVRVTDTPKLRLP